MKILNSIKERIATAISPAKLLEYTQGKEKAIQKSAPSIAEACQRVRFAYESTMPLSLTSKANVEKANEALKAIKAKDIYKK